MSAQLSKLSARLADFLRASAALLESAFLGLGLPKGSVMPEPNSCCQWLITVVSACELTFSWSDLRYLMSKPSKSLESKSFQHVAQSSSNFLWGEPNICHLKYYLFNWYQPQRCVICPNHVDASKVWNILPNPAIILNMFAHLAGGSKPIDSWKLVRLDHP